MRDLVDDFFSSSCLFLGVALPFGFATVYGGLSGAGRTPATFVRPLPFVPLSILIFVLLGFLLHLLVGAAGRGGAADDSGGDCEGGARGGWKRRGWKRRGRRRAGGGSRSGDGGPVAVLRGPVRGEGVPAGGALVHGQVLGAAALGGAGGVGVGGRAGLLVRRGGGVRRDGEMGGGARGDVGGEGRALGAGASLGSVGGGGGGPPAAEVGDPGFLGGQRVDEVKVWLELLEVKHTG